MNECRGGKANNRHFAVADGTALHWAVYYGQLEIAKLLLANGAGISTIINHLFACAVAKSDAVGRELFLMFINCKLKVYCEHAKIRMHYTISTLIFVCTSVNT